MAHDLSIVLSILGIDFARLEIELQLNLRVFLGTLVFQNQPAFDKQAGNLTHDSRIGINGNGKQTVVPLEMATRSDASTLARLR